jgi:hypothetical protein
MPYHHESHCAAVVFIESEDTKLIMALGGYTSAGAATGIKRVDYHRRQFKLFHQLR